MTKIPHFLLLLAVGTLGSFGAQTSLAGANELTFNGFISQAFLKSQGNNLYGDSRNGSFELMEAAINSNWRFSNRLHFAGQLITRDAGNADNGDVTIDYLFADYKLAENDQSGLGIRLGRVRNNYGFYNDTRDVIFTRPTIIMPQAVYFEGNGLREFLFSSDGMQLYGYWDKSHHSTHFSLSMGLDKELPQDSLNTLTGASRLYRDAKIKSPVFAQLMHIREGGKTRYAISGFDTAIRADTTLPGGLATTLEATGIVLSAERNYQQWSFNAEYSFAQVNGYTANSQIKDADSKTFYLQSRYRFNSAFIATLRYEHGSYDDDEIGNISNTKHWVVGLQWSPTPAWLFAFDLYSIEGTGGIPTIDNQNRDQEKYTTLAAAMIAYRF